MRVRFLGFVSVGEEKVKPCGEGHYGSLCGLPSAQPVIEDGAKRERTSLGMDILFSPVIVWTLMFPQPTSKYR